MEVILSNGKNEVKLGETVPYVLQNFETSVDIENYETKGINQDGARKDGSTLNPRSISIELTIAAHTHEELIDLKRKITAVCSPKKEITLRYVDINIREIIATPLKVPYFSEIHKNASKCLLYFKCYDPYWSDVLQIKNDIAKWFDAFIFPCEFLQEGIELGYRDPIKIVNVRNDGDHKCDMFIKILAKGNVERPKIMNVDTGEYIALNMVMHEGEIIEIRTEYGNKSITSIINGQRKSIWSKKDYRSVFFSLYPGDNPIKYDADDNINNMDVTIYYKERYLEV